MRRFVTPGTQIANDRESNTDGVATLKDSAAMAEREGNQKTIELAVEKYRRSCGARWTPSTRATYEVAIRRFERWALDVGVKTTDELTPERLADLRDYVIAVPKSVVVKGGKRGDRRSCGAFRSVESINRELRAIRTMLGYWLPHRLIPALSRPAIRRVFVLMKVNEESL
jgi:hypothetical protein